MDVLLWYIQGLLALVFLLTGLTKLAGYSMALKTQEWVKHFPRPLVHLIGLAELLGAIGLVLPWGTGHAKWLTPLAALCLAAVMLGAAVTHIVLKQRPQIVSVAVLAVLCLLVAAGRAQGL